MIFPYVTIFDSILPKPLILFYNCHCVIFYILCFVRAIYSTFCDNISSSIVWSILSVQCFIVVSPYNKWVLLPPPSRQHVAARHRGSSLFPPFVALCQWFCSDQHLPKVANMRFAQFQLPELSGLAVIMQRSNCDPPWV